MSEFPGFQKPQYTQVPNELLDEFMPVLSGSELKVALFVARKTFGWHKEDDDLSISQIMAGTGLSRPAVCTATDKLVERGLLVRREGIDNTPHNYRLNVQTSKESLLGVVKKVNSQKKLLKKSIKESADAANASPPSPVDTPSQPSKPNLSQTQTSVPAQVEVVPPPPTAEQAAANDAAFAALEAAPPEARQPSRARGVSKDAIERAIADVCYRADRDLRRANQGAIRAVGKAIRAMNADLETPVTAEMIYHVFEDSGYWQRHFMSLDETTNTRHRPTPGIVGKHTLNILAWGKGQTHVQTGEDAIREAIALNERVLGDAPDLTQTPTTTRRLTRPPVVALVRPLSQTA